MEQPNLRPEQNKKELSEDHWFQVAEGLREKTGRIPDPIQIRADAIRDALRIPAGEYSALETDKKSERQDSKKDRIIAEYLTNKSGVIVSEDPEVISRDFRDMYPGGLPENVIEAFGENAFAIVKKEYEHRRWVQEQFPDTQHQMEADYPNYYFRLPGGVDLFMRGYGHQKVWQDVHGDFLKDINKHAEVITVEGSATREMGDSMDGYWGDEDGQQGHYDVLMKESVVGGFDGLFTEIDARDQSSVRMDAVWESSSKVFPDLPDPFFDTYHDYLSEEYPSLTKEMTSPEDLKNILQQLSLTKSNLHADLRENMVFKDSTMYTAFPYKDVSGETKTEPAFLELGKMLFTDALAAIKLHLIARLMADGHINNGPIIDYEGSIHLPNKAFFIEHPKYAMEVVLSTVNELMAGHEDVEELKDIYEVFADTDWSEVIKEIARLEFRRSPKEESEEVHDKELRDYSIDFLDAYDINPEAVMPSDEEIEKIRNSLAS